MIQNDSCKYCKCTNMVLKECGPHYGLYCKKCGKWQQWVKKSDLNDAFQHGWKFGDVNKKYTEIKSDFDVVY